jgi:hypothetical protein
LIVQRPDARAGTVRRTLCGRQQRPRALILRVKPENLISTISNDIPAPPHKGMLGLIEEPRYESLDTRVHHRRTALSPAAVDHRPQSTA